MKGSYFIAQARRLRQQGVSKDGFNSGFVGKGRTAGGAREFNVPNKEIRKLQNVKVRDVK